MKREIRDKNTLGVTLNRINDVQQSKAIDRLRQIIMTQKKRSKKLETLLTWENMMLT